jgi:hypothetical protein
LTGQVRSGQVPLHDKHRFPYWSNILAAFMLSSGREIFDMEFNYDRQLKINVTYMTFGFSDIKDFRALFFFF